MVKGLQKIEGAVYALTCLMPPTQTKEQFVCLERTDSKSASDAVWISGTNINIALKGVTPFLSICFRLSGCVISYFPALLQQFWDLLCLHHISVLLVYSIPLR